MQRVLVTFRARVIRRREAKRKAKELEMVVRLQSIQSTFETWVSAYQNEEAIRQFKEAHTVTYVERGFAGLKRAVQLRKLCNA